MAHFLLSQADLDPFESFEKGDELKEDCSCDSVSEHTCWKQCELNKPVFVFNAGGQRQSSNTPRSYCLGLTLYSCTKKWLHHARWTHSLNLGIWMVTLHPDGGWSSTVSTNSLVPCADNGAFLWSVQVTWDTIDLTQAFSNVRGWLRNVLVLIKADGGGGNSLRTSQVKKRQDILLPWFLYGGCCCQCWFGRWLPPMLVLAVETPSRIVDFWFDPVRRSSLKVYQQVS